MEANSYVMSIDIGTTKIAAIIGRVNDNGKVVTEAWAVKESQGVRRGMVENVEETVVSIKQCLEMLHSKTSLRIKDVTVGIAGHHISSLQSGTSRIRTRPHELITEAELMAMQREMNHISLKPGQEILHITPQEYTIDNKPVKNPVGCDGSKLTASYFIVVSETAAIKKIQMCIERCNLRLKKLVLEPYASAESVLSAEEREEGVALLDIGGGTSDLIIIQQNAVRCVQVIPCGGEIITTDIQKTCGGMNRITAEEMKKEYGSCLVDSRMGDDSITFQPGLGREPKTIKLKTLAQIIQDRTEEIIEAVDYKITESGYSNQISSIVLTGGGAMLRNLTQLVKLHTGYDARIGKPCIHEGGGALVTAKASMATCVGLVYSGYEQVVKSSRPKSGLFSLPFGKKVLGEVMTRFDKVFNDSDDIRIG